MSVDPGIELVRVRVRVAIGARVMVRVTLLKAMAWDRTCH